ncbi:g5981 [Coccomyxa elongata]
MSTTFRNLDLKEDVSGSGVEDLAEGHCTAHASHKDMREDGFSEGYQDLGSLPLDSPEDAAVRSAGADMLHACDSAPQHNSISSHAGQGTVLPSVVISERASVPFATVYASADVTATSSQTEVLQEGCAASELDACPLHGDMAYPWEEDEALLTEAQSLDAYTGMYADLAARAEALAAELPGVYSLPPSSPTSCDAAYFAGTTFHGSGAYLGDPLPENLVAAWTFSGSGTFPGNNTGYGSDTAPVGLPLSNGAAYSNRGISPGSSTYFAPGLHLTDPQPRGPFPSWSKQLGECCSGSHEELAHEAASKGRSSPGSPGSFKPGRGHEQMGAQGSAGAAFESYRNAREPDRARLAEDTEQRVPWHELLLHAPLYPERDAVQRLSAARSRSLRFPPKGGYQRPDQNTKPAQRRPCANEWDDDVSMGRRPERRQFVADVAADVATPRAHSSEAAASPGRDRPRRSRFEAPNLAARGYHAGLAPDLAPPLEAPGNAVQRSRDTWPNQNRPQSAPQRLAAATPRDSAGTARSMVTRIKGPRKMDRVARWRQLQELWARDPFLRNGAAGGNKDGKRKKMGFREAFAEVHAANDEMQSLYVQLAASSASLRSRSAAQP